MGFARSVRGVPARVGRHRAVAVLASASCRVSARRGASVITSFSPTVGASIYIVPASCAMEHYSGPLLLVISECGAEGQKITKHFAEYAKTTPDFRREPSARRRWKWIFRRCLAKLELMPGGPGTGVHGGHGGA